MLYVFFLVSETLYSAADGPSCTCPTRSLHVLKEEMSACMGHLFDHGIVRASSRDGMSGTT
jgi:hypothetical protein